MSDLPKPPSSIAGGKFEVDRKLGAGCFGEVWKGFRMPHKEPVAVKFEDFQGHALQLEHEVEILKDIAKPSRPQGFVEVFYFGREGRYHCMVMEILGKSLEERMQACKGRFTPQTGVLLAEQVLHRIEYLHSKGIVHRDIKPENFMFGVKDKIHHLYLIDFGLSKKYWDGKHSNLRSRLSLTGTARYASINAHKGLEQSRRDDLEAIGHMLIYFLRGSLPWSGLEAKTQEEKYRKICEKKESVPLATLCEGHPPAFERYLGIARGLDFKALPEYANLRRLFRAERDAMAKDKEPIQDHEFQWFEGKDIGELVALSPPVVVLQPDQKEAKKPSRFCFCGSKDKVRD